MYINQALHGYQQGHNRVMSSITLPNIDEDRMKILSDWSEYAGGMDGDMSYITTYPLSLDNLYVVAKTWYANEMNRPGCVWTHSLIIDLSEIEETFDFRLLECYFHRPSKDDYSYDIKIEVNTNCTQTKESSIPIRMQDVWLIYNILLQNTTNTVFCVENISTYYQSLILSILQYLPIEIIKSLRLCSGGSTRRTDGSIGFNLVFSSMVGNTVSLSSVKMNDGTANKDAGILFICSSIYHSNSDIFQLIRMFSKDIGNSYIKLNTLGILLQALNSAYKGTPNMDFSLVLNNITSIFPTSSEGKALKRIFLGSKVGFLFTTEEDYYIQLCGLPDSVFDDWKSIGFETASCRFISSSSENFTSLIERLVSMESMNCEGKKIILKAAHIVSIPLLKALCKNNWSVFMALVSIRPALLISNYWLSLPVNKVSILFPFVEKIDNKHIAYWDQILIYILTNALDISTSFACKIYVSYPHTIAKIMDYIQVNDSVVLSKGINELCLSNKKDVIYWMETKNTLSDNVIRYIMKTISPVSDDVIELGTEPWTAFFKTKTIHSDVDYYLFLFRLSLNWKSTITLDMLKTSFSIIHLAMSKDELSSKEFSVLSPYMEDLPFWQVWDNCKKLRKGLVKYMKRLGYNRSDLNEFTQSNELNTILQKIWDKK